MALELKSFIDVLAETDDHNKNVVKTLTDQLKKVTSRTKTQRTWQLKTTNQVRRQKTTMRRMNETIDAMDVDYVELKTKYDARLTKHDTLDRARGVDEGQRRPADRAHHDDHGP